MHFSCTCGHRISNTTDHLPYAAHLIADVDAEDYWEAWERRGRGQALGSLSDPFDYEKEIYQCEECGRVWFEHPDEPWRFVAFAPEGDNVMVAGPAKGENWKGAPYFAPDELSRATRDNVVSDGSGSYSRQTPNSSARRYYNSLMNAASLL